MSDNRDSEDTAWTPPPTAPEPLADRGETADPEPGTPDWDQRKIVPDPNDPDDPNRTQLISGALRSARMMCGAAGVNSLVLVALSVSYLLPQPPPALVFLVFLGGFVSMAAIPLGFGLALAHQRHDLPATHWFLWAAGISLVNLIGAILTCASASGMVA